MEENKKKFLLYILGAWTFGILVLLVMAIWAYNDLPSFSSLKDYKPALVTEVLSRDGRSIGEFSIERRFLLPIQELPKQVISAFISGEDDRFFEHKGIDPLGILRAAFANFKAGKIVQGGSTITMQVAKALLQNSKKEFSRKFKEVILASRLESNLTKDEILYLYLNHIYLGFGAYGVEAASRAYFRKNAKDITIAEAALLAGLAKAPSRFSPHHSPLDARRRQVYVLVRMLETNQITKEQYEQAVNESVKIFNERKMNDEVAPYYVEYARQYLMEKYGQEKLYQGGMKIQVAADYELSVSATEAVKKNLQDLDKRQGYRGPIKQISPDKDEMLAEMEKIRYEVFEKKFPFLLLPTDKLETLQAIDARKYTYQKAKTNGLFKSDKDLLIEGEIYSGVVVRIEEDRKSAVVLIGGITAKLSITDMSWAKRIKANEVSNGATIAYVTEALKKGDVIQARVLKIPEDESPVPIALEQIPIVQSALVSMDVNTGQVLALVGGYSFEGSEYNRVTQAMRQPGSAFKPFVYAAALDKGFTPASIIVDSPIIFENQGKEDLKWIPENHSEKFYGDTTLRMALIKSRNVPTVKLLQEIQIPYLLDYAQNIGIRKGLNSDLSIALGANTISLMDLTKAYAVFPRNGMRIEPIFILKVSDFENNILYEYSEKEATAEMIAKWQKIKDEYEASQNPTGTVTSATTATVEENKNTTEASEVEPVVVNEEVKTETPEERMKSLKAPRFDDPLRAMDARTAYVMNNILREVVSEGTGKKATILKRKVGGKTGTTSEYVDAWFVGYSPDIVTGLWVGFDSPRTMGAGETGARSALPAWMQYMQAALKIYTKDDYEVPKGIVFVRIDPETGAVANSNHPNAVKVAFVEGTEPTTNKKNSQVPDSSEFFKEDY